ncbi:MAG: MtaA/CmuA family methyltransferase [Candidatus Methanodesulfokora washburnensis]|jgi:[methyl-Co(III) methanol-specific corrinoid protein]:coenzyme M methyltransferase
MTPRERVLSALLGEKKEKVVVSCVTQVGTVEAMQKLGVFWPEAHKDPEKMVELGASLYKLVGLETCRVPFCLTVQAEALGCGVDMGTMDRQPSVRKSLPSIPENLPSDFLERGRMPAVIKAVELMKKKYENLPKMAGFEAIMTLAGHILGVEKMMIMIMKQRDAVAKALDLCTKANVEYTKALIDAGAEVIVPCDPTASPDLISQKDFASLVKPKLKELADVIKRKGAIGVLHICGRAQRIIKDMAETGFHALSVEEKVDVREAKATIGSKPALVGNVSAAKTLFMGTPADVEKEARAAIEAGIDVLAPGCGIAPRTPLANIKVLVDIAKKYAK